MRDHDGLHDVEPEADAAVRGRLRLRGLELLERIEDVLQVGLRDLGPHVVNAEDDLLGVAAHGDLDRRALGTVLKRIPDEVGQGLADAPGVPFAAQVTGRGEAHVGARMERPDLVDGLATDRLHVDRDPCDRDPRAEAGAGEVHEVPDERVHPRAGVQDARGRLEMGPVGPSWVIITVADIMITPSGLRRSWPRTPRNRSFARSTSLPYLVIDSTRS